MTSGNESGRTARCNTSATTCSRWNRVALDRATPARLATSVASETSSASKRRPGPSTKVITPMTSPLAVSGTARAVAVPCGSSPSSPASSGASCVRPLRNATAAGASEPKGRTSSTRVAARARPGAGARGSRTSSRTSPFSPGTWTEHESASLPSTRLIVRRITVVGSRLELRSRVTSERSDRRSRPASASRSASRSCSKTCARSSACAVRPASVERNRRSGSPGSERETKARESTPSGPELPTSGSLTIVTGLGSSCRTRGTTSATRSSPISSFAARVAMSVRLREKQVPAWLLSSGTRVRERSAGWPLLARQARPRSPMAATRTTADCAPSARRPPAMAAWATSPGVVAAARAELSWCRCWLRSRFTNSVRVSRARSTAWAAAPVMVKRKVRSGSEISRSSSQCTTTAPMVWSITTRGTMASARNRFGPTVL